MAIHMTEALFEIPDPAPLRLPTGASRGPGKITYARYRAKLTTRCDDCVRVLYEATVSTGEPVELPRGATWTRTQRRQRLFLCTEHKALRERDELEQAVLDEVYGTR